MAEYDVVIVGGGATGLTLSLALSHLPLRVLLLEPSLAQSVHQPLAMPNHDVRALALSRSSLAILSALGLECSALLGTDIRQIRISEQAAWGRCVLDANEQSLPAFGQVVSLTRLQQQLGLHNQQRANPMRATGLQRVQSVGQQWLLDLDDGDQVRCRFLAVADGSQSSTRLALDVETRQIDYGQVALSCLVQVELAQDYRAFEHFTAQGPLALLPVGDSWYSLVWSLTPTQAEDLSGADETEFLSALQRAFGWPLGRFLQSGPRQCFPLRLIEAKSQSGPGFVLVGNALRSLHPVAGQGFNLALRDVAVLFELLVQQRQQGADWFDAQLITAYRQWRLADQDSVMALTHGMVSLFSNHLPPLKCLRTALLSLLAWQPSLRRQLAQQAMGLSGRVPALARGMSLAELLRCT